jgi:hypothetical protein
MEPATLFRAVVLITVAALPLEANTIELTFTDSEGGVITAIFDNKITGFSSVGFPQTDYGAATITSSPLFALKQPPIESCTGGYEQDGDSFYSTSINFGNAFGMSESDYCYETSPFYWEHIIQITSYPFNYSSVSSYAPLDPQILYQQLVAWEGLTFSYTELEFEGNEDLPWQTLPSYSSGGFVTLTDVQIIPEPASWLLLVSGFVGLLRKRGNR